MCGLDLELKCKECGHEATYNVGITALYTINGNDCDYVPVHCEKCNKLHYIATESYIVEENTPEVREQLYQKAIPFVGEGEKAREWFFSSIDIKVADKLVYAKEEIETIENTGTCCF